MRRYIAPFLALLFVTACGLPHKPPEPPPIECPACPAVQPDGCAPCPPGPPPVATEGDLDGVARDQNAAALEGVRVQYLNAQGAVVGDAVTIGKAQSDHWCDTRPAPCSPAPAGYFSKPGKEAFGRYTLRVTLADGRVADSKPIDFDKNWRPSFIAFNVPKPPEPELPPVNEEALRKHLKPGTWSDYLSYYGGRSASIPTFTEDMRTARDKHFEGIRLWPDFMHIGDKWRTFNKDGSARPDALSDLEKKIQIASAFGISMDVTLQADAYDFQKVSGEGYKITAHKRVVKQLCALAAKYPGISNIDVANEGGQRGPGGNGSPQWGHISPGRYTEIQKENPGCPLTFSVDGDVERIADEYNLNFERGNKFVFIGPHFPRTASAPKNEGPNVSALRAKLKAQGQVIFNQEPFRRGVPGDMNAGPWKTADFVQANKGARAAGSVGICLHNGHWNLEQKGLFAQLDAEEMGYVNWVATQPN